MSVGSSKIPNVAVGLVDEESEHAVFASLHFPSRGVIEKGGTPLCRAGTRIVGGGPQASLHARKLGKRPQLRSGFFVYVTRIAFCHLGSDDQPRPAESRGEDDEPLPNVARDDAPESFDEPPESND
jgi:hypothetical protein